MEEYLKLNWRTTDFSLLSSEFIPESSIPSSYIFKGLDDIKDDDFKDNGKPFVPGSNYFKPIIKKTCLSKQQHVDCLHALQIMMKSKDKLNQYSMSTLELYNTLRTSIAAETKEFCEYVKQQWSNGTHNYHVRNYYKLYVQNCWKRNYDFIKSYQKMFICIKSLPISVSQVQSKVEVTYKQQLLDLGTVAKYLGPRLLDKCLLNNSSLPTNTVNTVLDFKKPVSSDRNINLIVENIPVDIVISMSGLKTLMNCDPNKSWDIPIIVKQIQTTKNGEKVMKSVVYIDKVLKTPKTNQLLVKERAFKEVIKTAFCCYKAFSYDSPGLSEIITDSTKIQNEESADKTDSKELKIHQNASYKLWTWKPNEVNELLKCRKYKELTVLIRNKMDACELLPTGQLQTVTLVPKLEYQLEFGGNISTKRELINQWCSLYFRPMSKLYRVRTHAVTSEIIMVEPCNIDKIVYEAQTHHHFHPNIGLQIVYNIFSTLSDLPPGNYLLHHTPNDGSFVSLLKSTTATSGNVYNLHNEYNETNYSMELLKTPPWIAIDTNLVLPVHEERQLVPGLFAGFEIATNKKRKQFNQNNKWKHKINTTGNNKDKEKFKKNTKPKKKKNNKAKRKKPNSETTSNT